MNDTPPAAANRRDSYRRRPKDGVRVTCHLGTREAGEDLALALLDASQTGLRLLIRQALSEGEEVAVTLEGPGCPPVRRPGVVMWSVADAGGHWSAGIRLRERLPFPALIRLTDL